MTIEPTDYTDPAFVSQAHDWARVATASLGLAVTGPIEQPHIRPWSTVFRVPTNSGAVYLKCCGPTQAHEPRLSALLHRVRPDLAPPVLAVHPERPWMLVAEGGMRLAASHRGDALLDVWGELLPRHADLQRAMMPHVDEALALGTPDRRSATLVPSFAGVIADEAAVSGDRPDRVTADERRALERIVPAVERACRDVDALGIGDTVQHDDLHHGNVLVRGGHAAVFDWGDACVSHPFLVLAVNLRFAGDATGRAAGDPRLLALRDAYLATWSDRASPAALRHAADLAQRIGQVSRALTFHAVARAYPGALDAYPGGLAGSLRRVLALFS
jgi:Phosphotransferase enzyme family